MPTQLPLLALVSIEDDHDKAELNAGALQRYLAGAGWLPTALLPSDHLTFTGRVVTAKSAGNTN